MPPGKRPLVTLETVGLLKRRRKLRNVGSQGLQVLREPAGCKRGTRRASLRGSPVMRWNPKTRTGSEGGWVPKEALED